MVVLQHLERDREIKRVMAEVEQKDQAISALAEKLIDAESMLQVC